MSSDVDLVFVTADPDLYTHHLDWTEPIGPARLIRTRSWGPVAERRFRRPSGLHVEVGVAPTTWANTDPLDQGTARVITDGLAIVYDPGGLLHNAQRQATSRK